MEAKIFRSLIEGVQDPADPAALNEMKIEIFTSRKERKGSTRNCIADFYHIFFHQPSYYQSIESVMVASVGWRSPACWMKVLASPASPHASYFAVSTFPLNNSPLPSM